MQATFDLNQFDDYTLKQIVKKFTFRSGVNFYRSCRGAKEIVDRTKPVWDLPEFYLSYEYDEKEEFMLGGIEFTAEKFCRIGTVQLEECESDFIKETVLPKLEALGGVETIDLGWCSYSYEVVQLLLAAAKPGTVKLDDRYYDVTDDLFKNVRNLEIWLSVDHDYHMSKKIFHLARNRKTIKLYCNKKVEEIFSNFLENWLNGEATGTLDRLTLSMRCDTGYNRNEMETMLQHMEDQLQTFVKSSEGYFGERGLDPLRISSRVELQPFSGIPGYRHLLIDFHCSSLLG